MALIVGGTTVTGTQTLEASTLTGTASAINGSNITNLDAADLSGTLPAISGANLTSLPATVVSGASQVGATSLCKCVSGQRFAGDTVGGSNLTYATGGGSGSDVGDVGTWRLHGYSHNNGGNNNISCWYRIS